MRARYRLSPVFDVQPPMPKRRWRLLPPEVMPCPRSKRREHGPSCSLCRGRPYIAGRFVLEDAVLLEPDNQNREEEV